MPLARAVVGGLLTSTFLTLIVVPIMYTLLMKEGPVIDEEIEAELADRPEAQIAVDEAAGVAEMVPSDVTHYPLAEGDDPAEQGGIRTIPP